jgi:hypothetical protein
LKFRPALLVKGLDAFAEIVRAAQPPVALAFELDCEQQAGILDIVYQLLRAALRQWRKAAQLFDRVGDACPPQLSGFLAIVVYLIRPTLAGDRRDLC